jgi:serine/threonine protein kinase
MHIVDINMDAVRFTDVCVIGRGAYGTVSSASDANMGGTRVAVKHVKDVFESQMTAKRMLREIRVHRLLQREAPNVAVALLGAVVPSDKFTDVLFVMELMDCTLHAVCRNPEYVLSDDQIRYLAQQLLLAVHCMHSCGIVHRDIKPQNVLVNADCTLRLCDFGMARPLSGQDKFLWSDYVTTRWYRAPEMCVNNRLAEYTTASDMWSVGCVIAEMLLGGRALFPGKSSEHQRSLITTMLGPAPSGYLEDAFCVPPSSEGAVVIGDLLDYRFAAALPGASSLLRGLLKYRPSERLTAYEAMNHAFFSTGDPGDSPTRPSPEEPQKKTDDNPGSNSDPFAFDMFFMSTLELRSLLQKELSDLAGTYTMGKYEMERLRM